MANYAYLNLWCRKFSQENLLELYERLLHLFPASEQRPGFYGLTVRGVALHESPLLEQDDLTPVSPAEVVATAREFLYADCSCEVVGYGDLWRGSTETGKLAWRSSPAPVEFACYGPDFEERLCLGSGHFCLRLASSTYTPARLGFCSPRSANRHREGRKSSGSFSLQCAMKLRCMTTATKLAPTSKNF